jgi:hypothetical protein
MTSPVTFDYQSPEKVEKNTEVKLAMRFFVPNEYHNNTPAPSGDVYIEEDPEMTAAVIRFGRFTRSEQQPKQSGDRPAKGEVVVHAVGRLDGAG